MKRVKLLESYVEKIDAVQVTDKVKVEDLIEDISRICLSLDEVRELVLDYYNSDYAMELECAERGMPYERNIAYQSDLRKLKAKLEFKIAELEDEEGKELEKIRFQTQHAHDKTKIENIFNVTSSSNSNAVSKSSAVVTITYEQAIQNINNLSDNVLSSGEKDEIESKLAAIELASKKKDKNKTWDKIGNVLKFLIDKGVDVGIATFPYLNQIMELLSRQ